MVATSGRTLTASSGGAITPMFRRDASGDLVLVEPDRDEYVTPAKGSRARLQLSGISEVFEMTTQFSDQPVSKVRVEFLIEKGASNGAKMVEGRRFTELHTWVLSSKSNLGKLLGALRGEPIAAGEEVNPDDFIGTSFVATISQTDDGKWARVSPEAIEEGSVRLPQLPLAGAATAAAADGDDPFDEPL